MGQALIVTVALRTPDYKISVAMCSSKNGVLCRNLRHVGKKKKTMPKATIPSSQHVSVSIAADNELSVTYPDGTGKQVTVQKLVSEQEGDAGSHFTNDELLEVASFMHDSTDLRELYPDEIQALGWMLYSDANQNDARTMAHLPPRIQPDLGITNVLDHVIKRSRQRHAQQNRSRKRGSTRRQKQQNNRKRS
jgi:hypothetical protein